MNGVMDLESNVTNASAEVEVNVSTEVAALSPADISSPEPDFAGIRGWRVTLYTVWLAQTFAMLGFSFVMPFVPFYIRTLGVHGTAAVVRWSGLIDSCAGIMMACTAPFWGVLADRYGRRPMVMRAMFGGAIAVGAMGLAKNVKQLLGLRVVQGGVTGTVSASIALISSVVPRAELGFSLGLMQTAVFLGNSLGPLLGGQAADAWGYRLPFAITCGLLLICGLLVLFGAKERFVRPEPKARADKDQPKVSLRQSLLLPGVSGLLVVYLLLNLSGSFVGAFFSLYVEQVNGSTRNAASVTGIIIAITGVAAALSAVFLGKLSDRVGHRKVLIASTALAGIVCLPQAFVHNVWQLAALRIFSGFAAGGMSPSLNAIVARTVPRGNLGRAYGSTVTAAAIGWSTGPLLGSWVASVINLQAPFVIMGCLMLLMALVVRIALKRD
jgi:MFS transporter, DHA1 family, multidrug resistance protein